jgi:DNA-binding transcriptional regulator YiaG
VPADEGAPERIAENLERQRALYGAPLGERIGRLTTALGISQGRLARTLGLSPAMVSQLASGRRCKIADPDVLARLQLLDQHCAELARPPAPAAVTGLLAEVARARWRWTAPTAIGARPAAAPPLRPAPPGPVPPGSAPPGPVPPGPAPPRPPGPPSAVDALRGLAAPHRLAAAAAVLAPGFPELAEALRRAAARG